jgi:DNA-binding PadR family transcriptional regulator
MAADRRPRNRYVIESYCLMNKDLRTAWLLLLLRDVPGYGYELRRDLAARSLVLDPAPMYRSLRALERADMISSRWMRSLEGPRRRVYEITPAGHAELARLAATLRSARDAQDAFLAVHGAPGTTGPQAG